VSSNPSVVGRLLEDLAEAGLVIRLQGEGSIYVAPEDRLTPDLRQRLLAHKADVVELLGLHGDELLGLFDWRRAS
jgi:TubC N-terminal docking domain